MRGGFIFELAMGVGIQHYSCKNALFTLDLYKLFYSCFLRCGAGGREKAREIAFGHEWSISIHRVTEKE